MMIPMLDMMDMHAEMPTFNGATGCLWPLSDI